MTSMSGSYEGMQGGKVLIVADDLTGAGDTAVQFAKRGMSAVVRLDSKDRNDRQPHVDVHVLNTDSRSLSPAAAANRVRASLAGIDWSMYGLVYKKIDSTFRGNIGAELDVLLEAGGFDCAVLTPAYPRQKRRVIGGYLLVDGELLEDTQAARDPVHPVHTSYLPDLLEAQSRTRVVPVTAKAIRQAVRAGASPDRQIVPSDGGPFPVHEELGRDKACYLFDAANDGDLQFIAAAAHAAGKRILWVGSAGLAGVLADRLRGGTRMPKPSMDAAGAGFERHDHEAGQDVLVVAGSVHPAARRQAAYVRERGFGWLELDPTRLACGHAELTSAQHAAWAKSRTKGGWVLTTAHSDDTRQSLERLCQERGWSPAEAGARIADSLGRLAAELVQAWDLCGLVLTGGDVAYSSMRALGVHALEIRGEVEDGLPWCRPCGERWSRLAVVTKAGGFGSEQALYRAAYLAGERGDDRDG